MGSQRSGALRKTAIGDGIAIIGTCLLALAFRLSNSFLSYDEVQSVVFASNGAVSDVWANTLRHDVHPPVYYLILRLWAPSPCVGCVLAQAGRRKQCP